MRIALHACCGPCSTVPVDELVKQGHEVALFYSNSNIHPEAEYNRRLETIRRFAESLGLEMADDEYIPNRWVDAIGDNKAYSPERCRMCYRMRLRRTARFAKESGFDAIATSLSISPYQFTDVINEELAAAAEEFGLIALEADYRSRYQDSVDMSREAGMYRQNYCGCMYSLIEATDERTERRKARKAAKEAEKTARQENE